MLTQALLVVPLLHLHPNLKGSFWASKVGFGLGLRERARRACFHPSCDPAAVPALYRPSRFSKAYKRVCQLETGPPRQTSTEESAGDACLHLLCFHSQDLAESQQNAHRNSHKAVLLFFIIIIICLLLICW